MIELAMGIGGSSQSNLAGAQMDAVRTLSDRAGSGERREESEHSYWCTDGCWEDFK